MVEFTIALEHLTHELLTELNGTISIRAGCELFSRFAARMASEETGVISVFKFRNLKRLNHH